MERVRGPVCGQFPELSHSALKHMLERRNATENREMPRSCQVPAEFLPGECFRVPARGLLELAKHARDHLDSNWQREWRGLVLGCRQRNSQLPLKRCIVGAIERFRELETRGCILNVFAKLPERLDVWVKRTQRNRVEKANRKPFVLLRGRRRRWVC